MSAEILVVRGFLRANPTITDIPVVANMARNKLTAEGYLLWPNSEDADVFGSRTYRCDIPDLNVLFKNVDLRFPVWKPKTHRDVAKVVFDALGVAVKVDDIEPTVMSYDPLPNSVTLKALSDATTAKGSVVVNIYQKPMDISEIITTTEVVGVVDKYPLTDLKLVLEKKYYGYDFTDVRETLLNNGYFIAVMTILNSESVRTEMSSPMWGSDINPIPYNFAYPSLVYNGPTAGFQGANLNYTHCRVYRPTSYSTGTVGQMILHYNA